MQGASYFCMHGYSILIVLAANGMRLLMTKMAKLERRGSKTKQDKCII